MRRRELLKSAAAASMLLSPLGLGFSRSLKAQSLNDYLFVCVDARGAWDPTQLCDPKGGEPFSSYFAEGDIRTAGNIRYAPMHDQGGLVEYMGGPDAARAPFFPMYADDLVVLNGVDTKTNSHDVGPRHVWSGNLRTGFPSIAALVGAIKEHDLGQPLPMAMLSTGGFDATAGLLPPARAGNVNALLDLTLPNRVNPRDPNNLAVMHNDRVMEQIRAAEVARQARQDPERVLPAVKRAMAQQWSSRTVEASFAELHAQVSAMPELSAREAANPVIASARVALAGMGGGVCQAAMLSTGGFDTHANHDSVTIGQRFRLQQLLDVIDYVVRTSKALGTYDRTIIVVGADFARTIYNDANPANETRGKDHWPITSMMLLGGPVSGGRTIGQTDRGPLEPGAPGNLKGHRASKITERGGELVVTTNDDPTGEILTPTRVHQSLRALAGLDGHPVADKFLLPDVPQTPLPIV